MCLPSELGRRETPCNSIPLIKPLHWGKRCWQATAVESGVPSAATPASASHMPCQGGGQLLYKMLKLKLIGAKRIKKVQFNRAPAISVGPVCSTQKAQIMSPSTIFSFFATKQHKLQQVWTLQCQPPKEKCSQIVYACYKCPLATQPFSI